MIRVDLGVTRPYCDQVTRRSFLQIGATGLTSLSLPQLLRAKEASAAKGIPRKDTSVILLWLDGGPSHMDLYDLKPNAPEINRGIWKPIATKVPGFDITEMFPLQAKVTDKFSIVRSLYHNTGDHFAGGHRVLTTKEMGVGGANTMQKFPSIGAIAARELGSRKPGVPAHAAVPVASSIGLVPGYFGGHMIGMQYDPFQTGGDPNSADFSVSQLSLLPGLTIDRLENRRAMLGEFDTARKHVDAWQSDRTAPVDRFSEQAFDFVTGPSARKAFDISKEDPRLRDRYGRHNWGQSTLLARRLVEAGTTFVSVHFGGWDHHWNLKTGMESYLPLVDRAVSALFEDLDGRGLLDTTLVILCGEFSRTPKMNDGGNGGPAGSMGTPGRDHWGHSMFCLLGGGGLKNGQIVGSTDRLGYYPHTRPIKPSNLHATIYHVLGIDPNLELTDPVGRPVRVLDDPTPIRELL